MTSINAKTDLTAEYGINDELTMSWVIDEFDASIDAIARAGLRYGVEHSDGEAKQAAEQLLAELSDLHEEDLNKGASIVEHYRDAHDGLDFGELLALDCDDCEAVFEARNAAEEVWHAKRKALHARILEALPALNFEPFDPEYGDTGSELLNNCRFPANLTFDRMVRSFGPAFDVLAAASLRYHTEFSLARLNGEREARALALIELFEAGESAAARAGFVDMIPSLWS